MWIREQQRRLSAAAFFPPIPWSLLSQPSSSGWMGLRNKGNEEQAGEGGLGCSVRLQGSSIGQGCLEAVQWSFYFLSFLFSPSHEEIYLAQSLAVYVLKLELYAVWLQDTVFGYIIKAPNWNIRECDELFQVRPDKLAHWFLCHSHVSKYSRSFSGFVYRGNLTVSETDKQK